MRRCGLCVDVIRSQSLKTCATSAGSRPELHVWRKRPAVTWTVDAHIAAPRFDAERVQKTMVVVRKPVALVHGNIELVGALDQIEAVDRECCFRLSRQPLGIH